MKANPDKFQAICVGKKAHDNIESFQIGQTNIKCEENVTLLGINIDFMLKFDDYISEICKKASKQLAVLKRLGSFLTKQGKLVIYNSFIASNFSYCPLLGISVVRLAQINSRKYRKEPSDLYIMTIHLLSVPSYCLPTLSHFISVDLNKWHVKFLK